MSFARLSRRAVRDPVARTGAEAGRPIGGIGEPAPLERETPAPNAFGEAGPEALELGDTLVDPRRPGARET